jgi:hypothetical protein
MISPEETLPVRRKFCEDKWKRASFRGELRNESGLRITEWSFDGKVVLNESCRTVKRGGPQLI